jgi:hypothetical protein
MGQQQLLLIVLGIIIVGIAIVVGIKLFEANERASILDGLVNEGFAYAALVLTHYAKPVSYGGGGRSFYNYAPSGNDWVEGANAIGQIFVCSHDDNTFVIQPYEDRCVIAGYNLKYSAKIPFIVAGRTFYISTLSLHTKITVYPTITIARTYDVDF